MNNKKEQIVNTARHLFNENGYYQVTIRMIAVKMNISPGNLNYHFKKREDIFMRLYFDMVSRFDQRIAALPDMKISIQQIRSDMETSMNRMLEYSFFWTDLYNLLEVSKEVKQHFYEVRSQRIEGCLILFSKMKENGLMKDSYLEWELNFLAHRMIDFGNTWLYASQLYSSKFKRISISYHLKAYLSMLYPYLTRKGTEEFKIVFPDLFQKRKS